MPALDIDEIYSGQQNQDNTQQDNVPASDYWQGTKSAAHELQADVSALGRYISRWTSDTPEESERYWQAEQQSAEHQAESAKGQMSEAGRRRLEEDITSGQFWHDLYNSPGKTLGMKLAGNAPQLLAAALPAGPLSGAAAAAVMGVQGAGGGARAVYDAIDKMSDEELANQSKLYAGMLETMDPQTARQEYMRQMQGYYPMIEGALGAIAGYVGSPTAGKIGGGMLGRVAVGTAENAGVGAVLGGTTDAAQQVALSDANNQKAFDPQQLAMAVASGAAGQAPFGAMHAFHGRPGEPEAKPGAVDTGEAKGETPATSESNQQPQQLALPPPSVANRPHAEGTVEVQPTSYGQIGEEPPDIAAQQNAPAPAGEQPTANPVVSRGNQPAKNYGTGYAPAPPGVKVPEAEARENLGIGNPENQTTSRVPSDVARDTKRANGGLEPEDVRPGMPDRTQMAALSPEDMEDIKASIDTRRQEPPATPQDFRAHQEAQAEPAAPEELNERVAHAAPLDIHQGRRVLQEQPARQTPEEAARVNEEAGNPRQTPLGAEENPTQNGRRVLHPVEEEKPNEQVPANVAPVSKGEEIKAKARAKSEQQKARVENAATEEDRIRASHKSPEFKAAAIERIRQTDEIVKAHPPVDGETPEATIARAREMAAAASKVVGLDLSKPLRGAKPPASHAVLKQAYRLAKAKTKEAREKRLVDFADVERSARSGNKEYLAAAIKGQREAGDIAMGNRQRNPEAAEQKPSKGIAKVREVAEKKVEKAKVNKNAKAEPEAPSKEVAPKQAVKKVTTKVAAVKAKVEVKKAEVKEPKKEAQPATPRGVGKEEAAPKSPRRMGVNNIYEAVRKGEMSPADARDNIEELFPQSDTNPAQKEAVKRALKGINDLESSLRAGKAFGRSSREFLDEAINKVKSLASNKGPVPEKTNVRTLLNKHLDTSFLTGVPKAVQDFLKKRFVKASGDTAVHVVEPGQVGYDELKQVANRPGVFSFSDGGRRHIIVDRALFDNDAKAAHVVMHEVAHDFTERALTENPTLHRQTSRLLEEVRDHIGGLSDEEIEGFGTKRENLDYALSDPYEFMSEAASRPALQNILHDMQLSEKAAHEIGLNAPKRLTAWDGIVHMLRKLIQKFTGPLPRTGMEGVLRIMERIEPGRLEEGNKRIPRQMGEHALLEQYGTRHSITDTAREVHTGFSGKEEGVRSYVEKPTETAIGWAKKFGNGRIVNALTNMYNFAEANKHLIPLAPTIAKRIEEMGAFSQRAREEGQAITVRMIKAAKDNPDNFQAFGRLVNEQTMRGVRADYALGEGENSHLGLSKEDRENLAKGKFSPEDASMRNWAQRAAHEELAQRYKEVVRQQPELGQLMKDYFEYTRDTQSDLAGEQIKQILYDKGLRDEELYQQTQALTSKVSDAHYKHIAERLGEDTVEDIKKAKQLQVGRGPYSPLSRHGDYVVLGEYKYEKPKNATTSDTKGHTYEFETRKEAHDFAVKNVEHNPQVFKRRYDPKTGERITDIDDAKAVGAKERYEVQIDPRHIEMHESEAAARESQQELHKSGLLTREPLIEQRREYFRKQGDVTGTDISNAIKEVHKQEAYKSAQARGDKEVMRDMEQAVVNTLRKKSIGHKVSGAALPRRNVKGADANVIRNFTEYVGSMAKTRAKARYMPAVEALLKNARTSMEQARYRGPHKTELDPQHTARSVAMEELDKRAHAEDPTEYTGKLANLGRLLNVTNYVDRMMRPMHLILHQTHLPMITMPHIGGRHGFMQAYKEMGRVAGKMGLNVHGRGLEDFKAAALDPLHQNTNFGKMFRDKFKDDPNGKGIAGMLKDLEDSGTIHPQAGFEVDRYRPSNADTLRGKLETHVLGRVDSAFRALTDSTEAFNRYVGAITAYRLENAKQLRAGRSAEEAHQLATDYARDTIIRTQGQYSGTNASPLFKNRALRPFLQFRQFPLMMYSLLAHNANKAFRGASREERMQGAASILGIIGTHVAMTGLLGGLPLEIPKVLAWAGKTMGVTSSDWTDFERWQYEQMEKLTGKEGADWIMHGAGRHLFGADFHHRLGINSIIGTFGMPDYKYTTEKQLAWLTEFVTGAPGGLIKDTVKGSQDIMNGDVSKGALEMLPFQMFRDWRLAAMGGRERNITYTPGERVVRALGATPASEASFFERQHEMVGLRDQYNQQKTQLTRDWVGAKNGADKAKAFAKIQAFNKGLPPDAQLKMSALQSALRSKAPESGEDLKHHLGVAVGKNTKFLADRDRQLYAQ